LIIRSGHNIDPVLIESALEAHPAVAMAAAVGQPDRYAGELPVCYVALRPGAQATAEETESVRRAVDRRTAGVAEAGLCHRRYPDDERRQDIQAPAS